MSFSLGSSGQPDVAAEGVAGGEGLGARFAEARTGIAKNPTGIDFTTENT